ncbi:hypothetical protein H8E52_09685 [bacterium]|nr:hypothetical protein [bacterium]
MHRYDDPQSASSLFVGIVGIILVILTILVAQAYFFRMEKEELDRKNLPGMGEEAAFLRAAQEGQLEGYAPGENGMVKVPIEQAMNLVVEEFGP